MEKPRKRRLSWIPKSGGDKTGSFEGVGSGNLPGFTAKFQAPEAP